MDKRASHYAVALVLYPVLYTLTTWWRFGEFPPSWLEWGMRTIFMSLVVLTLLWFLPLKPGGRAVLYVALMGLGGILFTIWMNKRGIYRPEFGWDGMFRQFVYSQPRFLGCAAIIALILWASLALARARARGKEA